MCVVLAPLQETSVRETPGGHGEAEVVAIAAQAAERATAIWFGISGPAA